MATPHKLAEVLHAYADGKEIQWRRDSGELWKPLGSPSFYDAYEYRVKPQNTVLYCGVYPGFNGIGCPYINTGCVNRFALANSVNGQYMKSVLRIEINPDTLELVSAAMEKP